jgi:uncharacterized protein (DUF1501 family)
VHFIQPHLHSRRAFLKRAGQLAFTGAALPTAMNLAAMSEAAAFNASGDYKALVCVFLYGGNDYANTLIPYDPDNYAAYQTIRGTKGSEARNGIALGKEELAKTVLTGSPSSAMGLQNLQYALHPSMTGMHKLFTEQKMAVVLNCGPLVSPITKAQYEKDLNLPPKLFSHNDQQSIWQSASPEGATVGWGGSIGDRVLSSSAGSSGNSLFTCISVTGNAVFLAGNRAQSYQVGTAGAVRIAGVGANTYPFGFQSVGTAMQSLVTGGGKANQLESEYNLITKRAFDAEVSISAALKSSEPQGNTYPANFTGFENNNSLAAQLRMVARLINGASALGNKRQVFMVSLGGFDLHDNLMGGHTRNMERVSSAIAAFQASLEKMGVAKQVTTFTASDFGRTLSSNGDGSDHGWGNHHFIVGGAVNGGRFYGYAPPVSVAGSERDDGAAVKSAPENQWHVGQGRLLPTTSVDQYAATLAKWFGVEASEMTGAGSILPYLDNFDRELTVGGTTLTYAKDLGFMQ